MYVYQPRDNYFQKLNPAVMLFYLMIIMGGAVFSTHPLLLLSLLIPLSLALILTEGLLPWLRGLKFLFFMLSILFLINTLINKMGATIIWTGPRLPGFGQLLLTGETIVFVLVMGLRLLIVFSVFSFANLVVNPDQVLTMCARLFPRSALLVALTSRLIPHLALQLQRAAEIQQCRGVHYHTGNCFNRIKNRFPLVKVMLLSSLEDSFSLGESIQSRAYGCGVRTSYYQMALRLGDWLALFSTIAVLFFILRAARLGLTGFQFYPRLGLLITSWVQLWFFALISFSLLLPVFLAWGWGKWPCIRWRI
ncbi:MAG: energy-coupling factor transporter transmembrane component T [bacterium]